MSKRVFLMGFAVLMCGVTSMTAQVGINNEEPNATLDVSAKNANDATELGGFIAPRYDTGDQLRAKTYTAAQTGAIVYVKAADSAPAGQTVNITTPGYYYFDGTVWVHVTNATDVRSIEQNTAWMLNGNTNGAVKTLGTTDNNDLPVITNNTEQMRITAAGNVGIGTPTPAVKLDIENGTTAGAVKIADGTQGTGKVITSDANGVGTWQYPALQMVLGTIGAGVDIPWAATTIDVANYLYTGDYITLPPGMWKVEINMLLSVVTVTAPTSQSDFSANNWLWVRTSFCDSPTTLTISGDIVGTSTLISAKISGPFGQGIPGGTYTNDYDMLNGYVVINNTSSANKTYYYYVYYRSTSPAPASGTYKLNLFGGAQNGENKIIAEPVQQ